MTAQAASKYQSLLYKIAALPTHLETDFVAKHISRDVAKLCELVENYSYSAVLQTHRFDNDATKHYCSFSNYPFLLLKIYVDSASMIIDSDSYND